MGIELVVGLYSGFHFESEIRMMNRICDGITDGVIVSIGSYRGQMDIALALHAHVPVYCIDPRVPSDSFPFGDANRVEWMRNVLTLGVGERVRPINLPSLTVASVWTEPISLLWIDGAHSHATLDLEAWLPFVVDGGLIAFHDAADEGPRAAYEGRTDLTQIEAADVTIVLRKGEVSPYEPFTAGPLTLLTRKGVYSGPDKHVVAEVQTYPLPPFPLSTVIDAGAMIGAFSAWVHYLYPEARIIAIEPEPGNYELALRNMRYLTHDGGVLPNIAIVNAALTYVRDKNVLVVDPINSGGHRLRLSSEKGQNAALVTTIVTLEELMTGDFSRVSMLKLDVEGAENDILLSAADDTLQRIGFICGERHVTHEQFQPVIDRLVALGFAVTDEPHKELSVDPWFMNDRGIFTALNTHWTITPEELPFEYGMALDADDLNRKTDELYAQSQGDADVNPVPPVKRKATRGRKR